MKLKKKSWASAVLAGVMAFSLMVPAWASAENAGAGKFTVTAPTFPEAYILIEEESVMPLSENGAMEDTITATVFVREKQELIDGEWITVDSVLLSKEEVEAAGGVENFGGVTVQSLKDKESDQKLTLRISGANSVSGTSNNLSISAIATWSGESAGDGKDGAASGEDYMGILWGGDFSVGNVRTKITSMQGNEIPMYQAKITPNAAVVWRFEEFIKGVSNGVTAARNDYAETIEVDMTLKKNVMTGNGNVTDVVCEYIHTYSTISGSVSIGFPEGFSFSISEEVKQWPLSVAYSNARY